MNEFTYHMILGTMKQFRTSWIWDMTLEFPLPLLPTTHRKNNLYHKNCCVAFLQSLYLTTGHFGMWNWPGCKPAEGLRMGLCLQGWRESKEDLFQEPEGRPRETRHGLLVIGWYVSRSHLTSSENSQNRGLSINNPKGQLRISTTCL